MIIQTIPLIALGVAIFLLAILLPVRYLAAGLGLLLPIWSLHGLSPTVLFVTRVILVFVILTRCRTTLDAPKRRYFIRWFSPVVVLGLLLLPLGWFHHDNASVVAGGDILESTASALVIVFRPRLIRHLLHFFVLGTLLSEAVVCLQAIGITGIATPSAEGSYYHIGLSSNATKGPYEAAISIILVVGYGFSRSVAPRYRLASFACVIVLLLGMLAGGGRGGLLALAVAALCALFRARPREAGILAAGSAVGAGCVAIVLQLTRISPSTLTRILGRTSEAGGNAPAGITNGRIALDRLGLQALERHPFDGGSMQAFLTLRGSEPHFGPIWFGVAGGLIPAALAAYVYLRMSRELIRPGPSRTRSVAVSCALLGVIVTNALLEPTGPLVGMETVVILAVALLYRQGSEFEHDARQERTFRVAPSG
jgi:hypothetical protein